MKKNKSQLKQYRGQWIAYDGEGIIAHHANYEKMIQSFTPRSNDYLIERIYETEFIEPVKFYPIRFKILKKHEWQPKYPVTLTFQITRNVNLLVDSGADISLVSYQLGLDLGYKKLPEEINHQEEGLGGSIEYLLRNIEMKINSHHFSAPVAWLQTEHCEEALLGREVVFDLFDIEFKQAEESIIFKKRSAD